MSLEVLASVADNSIARAEMKRQGINSITPWVEKVLRKAHLVAGVNVGMREKSWDVLRTLQFIEQHVQKGVPILDLGAYASEVLCSLRKMGFSDLTGIDLNPALCQMPHNDTIKYVTGDFTETRFMSESFGVITAISVLEHGFCGPKIFREVSRLLRTNGYLIGSIDYWPEKIDTNGVRAFGLDWTIFSKEDLLALIDEAGKYGLIPVGQLNFEAAERTISWLERDYTFAWLALQKVDSTKS